MNDIALQADVERFIAYFGDPQNLIRLQSGDSDQIRSVVRDCPFGALMLLTLGLWSAPDILSAIEKKGLRDLAVKARVVLDSLAPIRSKLGAALSSIGVQATEPQTVPEQRPITLSFRPVFAVREKRVEISWIVREGAGPQHSSTHGPEVFMQAFIQLGQHIKAGWEGMKEIGWSMDREQAKMYAMLLRGCAKTVEELSLLIHEDGKETEETERAGS